MKRPDLEQFGRVTSRPYNDDENFSPAWGFALIGCIMIVLGAVIFPSDAVEQAAAKRQQCEMWEIWHADRRAGVPIEQRYGWPDQAGRFYKECEQ